MKNTSLCYIERGDEFLMLHRVKLERDENAGKWIGVGGKFKEGESPDECMLREVKEETGLSLKTWRFRGIVSFCYEGRETEYMHLFTAQYPGGELLDCDEGVLEWKKRREVRSLPIWEGDRAFLKLLDANEPFFSLKLNYDDKGNFVSALLNGNKFDI